MATVPRFPLRVFYDGACPLCSREIGHYLRRDRKGQLVAIDISAKGFDPSAYRISRQAFMRELHAIDQGGTVYRGVEAFRAIWLAFPEVFPYRVLAALAAMPLLNPLACFGYRAFARVRPRLPGRGAGCEAEQCGLHGTADKTIREADHEQGQ